MKCLGASFFVKWCAKHRSCLSNEANIFFVAQNYNFNRRKEVKIKKITHLVSYRGENQKNGLKIHISPWKNQKNIFFIKIFKKFPFPSLSYIDIVFYGKFCENLTKNSRILPKLLKNWDSHANLLVYIANILPFSTLLCNNIQIDSIIM